MRISNSHGVATFRLRQVLLILAVLFPLISLAAPATPNLSDPIGLQNEATLVLRPNAIGFFPHPINEGSVNFTSNVVKHDDWETLVEDLSTAIATQPGTSCAENLNGWLAYVDKGLIVPFVQLADAWSQQAQKPGFCETFFTSRLAEVKKIAEQNDCMDTYNQIESIANNGKADICSDPTVMIDKIESYFQSIFDLVNALPNENNCKKIAKNTLFWPQVWKYAVNDLFCSGEFQKQIDKEKQKADNEEELKEIEAIEKEMQEMMSYSWSRLLFADVKDEGEEIVNSAMNIEPYQAGYPIADSDATASLPVERNGVFYGIAVANYQFQNKQLVSGEDAASLIGMIGETYPILLSVRPNISFYNVGEKDGKSILRYAGRNLSWLQKAFVIENGQLKPGNKCMPIKKGDKLVSKICKDDNQSVAMAGPDINGDGISDIVLVNRGEGEPFATIYLGKKPTTKYPTFVDLFDYDSFIDIGQEPYSATVIKDNKESVLITTADGIYKISYENGAPIAQNIAVNTPVEGYRPYQIAAVDLGGECDGFAFTSAQISAGEPGKPETASITFANKFTVYRGEKGDSGKCDKYTLVGHYSAPQAVAGEGDDAINNPALLAAITFAPADEEKGLSAGLWLGDQFIYKNADGDKMAYAYFYPIEGAVEPLAAVKYRVSKEMDYLEDGLPGGGVKQLRVDAYGNLGVALGYPKVWQELPKMIVPEVIVPTPPEECPQGSPYCEVAPPPPKVEKCPETGNVQVVKAGKEIPAEWIDKDGNGDGISDWCQCRFDADKDGVFDMATEPGMICDNCYPKAGVVCNGPSDETKDWAPPKPTDDEVNANPKLKCYNPAQDPICDAAPPPPLQKCDCIKNGQAKDYQSVVCKLQPDIDTNGVPDKCELQPHEVCGGCIHGGKKTDYAKYSKKCIDQLGGDKDFDGVPDDCDSCAPGKDACFGPTAMDPCYNPNQQKKGVCLKQKPALSCDKGTPIKDVVYNGNQCYTNDLDCDGFADTPVGCDDCPPVTDKAPFCAKSGWGTTGQPCNPNEPIKEFCNPPESDNCIENSDCKDAILKGTSFAKACVSTHNPNQNGCPPDMGPPSGETGGGSMGQFGGIGAGIGSKLPALKINTGPESSMPTPDIDKDERGGDPCECFYSTDPKASANVAMTDMSLSPGVMSVGTWFKWGGDDKVILPEYDYVSTSHPNPDIEACKESCASEYNNNCASWGNTCEGICTKPPPEPGEAILGDNCEEDCAGCEKCKSDCDKMKPEARKYICGDPDSDLICSQKLAANEKATFQGTPLADLDNCPFVYNPSQTNTDGDKIGDACDDAFWGSDIDGDHVIDDNDNCPFVANKDQADNDNDGIGNACDTSNVQKGSYNCLTYGDEYCQEKCPSLVGPYDYNDSSNPKYMLSGVDSDADGVDDACDQYNFPAKHSYWLASPFSDIDGDKVINKDDNCPFVANFNQKDPNGNKIGYGCDCNEQDYICQFCANATGIDSDGDGNDDGCDADLKNHSYWQKWKDHLKTLGINVSQRQNKDINLISSAFAAEGDAKKAFPSTGEVTVLINKFVAPQKAELALGECFVDIGRNGKQAAGIGELNSSYDTYVRDLNDKIREMVCKAALGKDPKANCANQRIDLFFGEGGSYYITCAVGRDTPPPAGTTPGWALYQLGGIPLDPKYFAKDNYRPSWPPPTIEVQQAGKVTTITRDDLLKNSATRLLGTLDTPATAQKGIVPNVTALDFAMPSIVKDKKAQLVMPDKYAFAQNIAVGGLSSIWVNLGADKADPLMKVSVTPVPENGDVSQLSISPYLSSQFQPGQVIQVDIEGYAGVDAASFVHPDLAKPYVKYDPNVVMDTLAEVLNSMAQDPAVTKIEYSNVMKALNDSLKAKGADWDPTGYWNITYVPTMGESKAGLQPEVHLYGIPLSALPASGAAGCGRCSLNGQEEFETGNVAIVILMGLAIFAPVVWRRRYL